MKKNSSLPLISGLGLIAVGGLGYYFYSRNKKKKEEQTSQKTQSNSDTTEETTQSAAGDDEESLYSASASVSRKNFFDEFDKSELENAAEAEGSLADVLYFHRKHGFSRVFTIRVLAPLFKVGDIVKIERVDDSSKVVYGYVYYIDYENRIIKVRPYYLSTSVIDDLGYGINQFNEYGYGYRLDLTGDKQLKVIIIGRLYRDKLEASGMGAYGDEQEDIFKYYLHNAEGEYDADGEYEAEGDMLGAWGWFKRGKKRNEKSRQKRVAKVERRKSEEIKSNLFDSTYADLRKKRFEQVKSSIQPQKASVMRLIRNYIRFGEPIL